MKIACTLFLCFSFAVNSFGSPLIFKYKGVVSTSTDRAEYKDFASFNVSKYKKIRVSIIRHTPLAEKATESFRILAIEGGERVPIDGDVLYESKSVVLDVPSDEISISLQANGTFTVYVWGQ